MTEQTAETGRAEGTNLGAVLRAYLKRYARSRR